MMGTPEVVLLLVMFAPMVVGLVAVRGDGRGWARTRVASYGLTTTFWLALAASSLGSGNTQALVGSGAVAVLTGWRTWAAWRALRRGDFRPARERRRTPSRPAGNPRVAPPATPPTTDGPKRLR